MAPDRVAQQMRAALAANPVAAIKIGMLATSATIAAVAKVLADHPDIPVVLDPVLVSTSGRALLLPDATDALLELFSSCTLVTPNLPELSVLAAVRGSVPDQARSLLTAGAKAVLVKGGHANGMEAIDILFQPKQPEQHFASPRLAATMRGTGCMLSTAIAARLAFGNPLSSAIAEAKAFVHGKLRET